MLSISRGEAKFIMKNERKVGAHALHDTVHMRYCATQQGIQHNKPNQTLIQTCRHPMTFKFKREHRGAWDVDQ